MKTFSLSDSCVLLGYNLFKNKKDVFGVNHKFETSPLDGNGGINYFDNKEDLQEWINQVKEIRNIEFDAISLLEYLEG